MATKKTLKPIAAAIGTTFAVSLAASPLASAEEDPFSMTQTGIYRAVLGRRITQSSRQSPFV